MPSRPASVAISSRASLAACAARRSLSSASNASLWFSSPTSRSRSSVTSTWLAMKNTTRPPASRTGVIIM